MEIEYAEKYAPLYKRRAEIVAGDVEPSPTECVFPGEEADNDNEAQVCCSLHSYSYTLLYYKLDLVLTNGARLLYLLSCFTNVLLELLGNSGT